MFQIALARISVHMAMHAALGSILKTSLLPYRCFKYMRFATSVPHVSLGLPTLLFGCCRGAEDEGERVVSLNGSSFGNRTICLKSASCFAWTYSEKGRTFLPGVPSGFLASLAL